jgi:hypothetical protein
VVTTLLNVEGKSLTEVTLRLRNHAQPFMRVELAQGASLLSAEVEGEKVKPVQGSDGSRVPLLRAGFRPSGSYTVSFVILNSGASFGKSGSYEMGLPKVDIPVSLLRWEVFLPDRLQVKQFEGNALPTESWPPGDRDLAMASDDESAVVGPAPGELNLARLEAGQLGGIVFDPNGAMVVNATVTVTDENTGSTQSTVTDAQGRWAVFGLRTGVVRVRVEAQGFKSSEYHQLDFNASRSTLISSHLEVAGAAEQITVQGTARIDRESRSAQIDRESRRLQQEIAKSQQAQINAPSSNVINFQRKVAGILPVRVEVPRAGKSYRFVRPLILEEETTIKFRYRLK